VSTTTPSSRYVFGSRLASGGMGGLDLVVRRETHFRRVFVRKRIRRELSAEPGLREMFLDEARIAGMIRHPNVVPVVDVGEDEDGLFLVMELVEGASVSQLMRELATAKGGARMPLSVAAAIASGAAVGLHAAHELTDEHGTLLGLVHRDVSPQNILVGFDGIVRVTDFGISRSIGRLSQTSTGILKGKMGYLAPEVLQFEEIDRRADLFALGAVLYEMLAGARLYGSDAQGARRVLKEPAPDIRGARPDVPADVARLIRHLLAKSPDDRPATAAEVALALAPFASGASSVELGTYLRTETPTLVTEMRARVAEALAASNDPRTAVAASEPARDAPRPPTAKLRLIPKARRAASAVASVSDTDPIARASAGPSSTATDLDPVAGPIARAAESDRAPSIATAHEPDALPAGEREDLGTRAIPRRTSRRSARRWIAPAALITGTIAIAIATWATIARDDRGTAVAAPDPAAATVDRTAPPAAPPDDDAEAAGASRPTEPVGSVATPAGAASAERETSTARTPARAVRRRPRPARTSRAPAASDAPRAAAASDAPHDPPRTERTTTTAPGWDYE
jgi:serine/threonine protein kinase